MKSISQMFCLLLLLAGCSGGGSKSSTAVPTFSAALKLVGENGDPVQGATLAVGGVTLPADAQGTVQLTRLAGPVLAVASAPGHLAEPVVAGWEDAGKTVTVRLLSEGAGRWVMHSAGDTMFGRRYQTPLEESPLVPADNAAAGARSLVSDVAKAFSLGDLRTLNLETTVSDLPASAAFPGKRFVLNTPSAAMAALKELGTDVAFLANNHTRDYGEQGLRLTMAALDAQGVKYQGASDREAAAYEPLVVSVKGVRVGMLSWTSVTGTVVNDSYPVDGDPVPAELPAAEAWQYQSRSWGYAGPTWSVPVAARRIGAAWVLFRKKESDLAESERAAAWASLSSVYPELQDWVARRGHGGAALWRDAQSPQAIAALKETADLAVVQLHSGFQYSAAPSDSLRQNARAAIDAGADIVICHHPHVTQGFEWYKGRLIAYSLGNFVFDQDFLGTFSGFFLRTVWDGKTLKEARLIPTELSGYRPVPTSGAASLRTALDSWEKSLLGAESRRDPLEAQVKIVEVARDAESAPAHLMRDGSSFSITAQEPPRVFLSLALPPGESAPLGFEGLVEARLGLQPKAAVLVGRDLFGWGRFEDDTADAAADGSTHWTTEGTRKEVVAGDAAQGLRFLRLTRFSSNDASVLVRPVARVPLQQHRLYRSTGGVIVPADPQASYTLRFMARISAPAEARVNFQSYLFDDADPSADPTSEVLGQQTVTLKIAPGPAWQQVEIEITPPALAGGITANQILFSLQLFPPEQGKAMLDIDGLELLEWRLASEMPARFGAFSRVKNTGSTPVGLQFEGLPMLRR